MSMKVQSARTRPIRLLIVLLAAVVPLLAAACSSGHRPRPHGTVVADLPIPFAPPAASGNREVIAVHVRAGERFSVKVATSDGPYWWAEQARPDPRLVKAAGDVNDGHCAPGLVGCQVPYFHVLVARHPGSTTMTWVYHAPDCQRTPPVGGGPACPATIKVTVAIAIG